LSSQPSKCVYNIDKKNIGKSFGASLVLVIKSRNFNRRHKYMNFNNFTIKSQEAVQEAVNLAQSRGQQTIETAHVLHGVMKVGENVTNFIFQKLGMNGQQIALVLDNRSILSRR
jgi:Clp amino terminal domain.